MKRYKKTIGQKWSKLSKDTNPNREIIEKVKKLKIDIGVLVIRDEFGDLEAARKFWKESKERIDNILKTVFEGKKLQKSDFKWMNTIHKMLRKRVTK